MTAQQPSSQRTRPWRGSVSGIVPRGGRIYPVSVKPSTTINRWGDWPVDCVEAIKRLVRGWYSTGGAFKCCDCEEFCQPHPHGVPHLGNERDGRDCKTVLCDECLIARARKVGAP